MAPPPPPSSNPRPLQPLQPTASVSFDWISSHPSIRTNAANGSSNSPPRPPPSAQTPTNGTPDPLPSHYYSRRSEPVSGPAKQLFQTPQQIFTNSASVNDQHSMSQQRYPLPSPGPVNNQHSAPPPKYPVLGPANSQHFAPQQGHYAPSSGAVHNSFTVAQMNYRNTYAQKHTPSSPAYYSPPQHMASSAAQPAIQGRVSNRPPGYPPIPQHNGRFRPIQQQYSFPNQAQSHGQAQIEYEYRGPLPGPPQDGHFAPVQQLPFSPYQQQSLSQRQMEFEQSSKSQRDQVRHWYEEQWVRQSSDHADHWVAYKGLNIPGPSEQSLAQSQASTALERSQNQALAEAIKTKSQSGKGDGSGTRGPQKAFAEVNKLMEDEGLDDISSSDEDFQDFKHGLTRAKYDLDILEASRENPDVEGMKAFTGRSREGKRGPRLAAEPRGDIKLRLAQASEAFLNADYEKARDISTEIIRLNAETHQAWTVLATCFYELGQKARALTALTYAAHLEPKNIDGWIHCASVFLEETTPGKPREQALQSAFFCYAAALRVDPKDRRARLGKAAVYIERDHPAGAVSQLKVLYGANRNDLDIMVNLCAAYFDNKEYENARDLYKETFARLKVDDGKFTDTLSWTDVNSYIAIYEQLKEYDAGIQELKSLSRWLLGRDSEVFWDNMTSDDREWDVNASRRSQVPEFEGDSFPPDRYGPSLPLELRAKLGMCRLGLQHHEEALRHFELFQGLDESGETRVSIYPDFYRSIADSLRTAELYKDALRFYEPLKEVSDENTGDLNLHIGLCYLEINAKGKAEESFHAAIELDKENVDARQQLANLYESMGETDQALIYVSEILEIHRFQAQFKAPRPVRARRRHTKQPPRENSAAGTKEAESSFDSEEEEDLHPVKYTATRRYLADPQKRLDEESSREDEVQALYTVYRTKLDEMRLGDREATRAWMKAARDLTNDFRSVRKFYPYDKYANFLGFQKRDARGEGPNENVELSAMVERLSKHLGANITADKEKEKSRPQIEMPSDHRGITFAVWLDIFLEYALSLAREGRMQDSYEICESAKDCALYYSNREDLFLIHVCWLTCALFLSDEEACVNVARFFMKDYQFTSDSYRMFSAVSRMVHSPVNWYSSGPSQKYMLRQIKAMDYGLVDEKTQKLYFVDKGSYSSVDDKGEPIVNDDLNIALLMLYGHILYAGGSYFLALNYFLRAYALDPGNAMINLNIGLAYVHQALKRIAENRQHLILQGTTYLFTYYDIRKQSSQVDERQEAHHNMGRVYHMLGLTNLAIPYYDKVFEEIADGQKGRDDMVVETAYNLSNIYLMTGNLALANAITRKWMVI